MNIERKQLGAAIRDLRQKRGLTQVELSRAAGLSETGNTVALIERGERGLSLDAMNRIASALQVPAGCLAILGSRTESGHPRLTELLNSPQRLISTTVNVQQELESGRRLHAKRRRRPVVHH